MSDRREGPGWWLASDGRWYPPESHPDVQGRGVPGAASLGVRYAGFWLRFGALLIDVIVVWIGMLVVAVLSAGTFPGLGGFVMLAFPWLYFALFESSEQQATPGKRAVGIKVTGMAGERIGFGRATGRFFGKFISLLIVYIGFLMAGWTEKKQALHDMMVDALVVKA